jgi:aminoglycoside phosphotransferase family enzyme
VLIGAKPVLFDAIEFDPTIASVDVLYDLAFPIMDFMRYDRHSAANALLNRYLGITSSENFEALAALPLFMSLRAATAPMCCLPVFAGLAATELMSCSRHGSIWNLRTN